MPRKQKVLTVQRLSLLPHSGSEKVATHVPEFGVPWRGAIATLATVVAVALLVDLLLMVHKVLVVLTLGLAVKSHEILVFFIQTEEFGALCFLVASCSLLNVGKKPLMLRRLVEMTDGEGWER
jgi:hypothetical protein